MSASLPRISVGPMLGHSLMEIATSRSYAEALARKDKYRPRNPASHKDFFGNDLVVGDEVVTPYTLHLLRRGIITKLHAQMVSVKYPSWNRAKLLYPSVCIKVPQDPKP